jgi:hypothetical protein
MGRLLCSIAIGLFVVETAFGDADSIGPKGINSARTTLTGAGIGIGQAELYRPGDPTGPGDPDLDTLGTSFNSTVRPKQVFYHSGASFTAHPDRASEMATSHAEFVAGIMISTDPVATGVAAPSGTQAGADLYSIGGIDTTSLTNIYNSVAENLQFLAQRGAVGSGTQKIWAINQSVNMSAGTPTPAPLNGSVLVDQFIDWSARTHDVLYVITGSETGSPGPVPIDNFNGITVAYSTKPTGGSEWNVVSSGNVFFTNPSMERTFIDILAPGGGLSLTDRGSVVLPPSTTREGTSFAAPHVTGTVAMLQQLANQQIMNVGTPRWKSSPGAGLSAPAQRHEVMKAVLMNSADKIVDDGTFTVPGDINPAPRGTFLGMEKTINKLPISGGNQHPTWFDSAAYDDDVNLGAGFVPLDDEMGTGQLNAKRALQQYIPGEYDANGAAVPNIGWDYGHTTGMGNNQKYVFAQQLTVGMFVSVTLAWDRRVDLDNDAGTPGAFNANDTFTTSMSPSFDPENDDQINDLDLHFLPQGAISTATEVAASISAVGTVEHIFFRIPATGNYEFWVSQFDQEMFAAGQDYAVAWWFGTAPPLVVQGDYNGDQVVDSQDYTVWRGAFGSTVTPGTGADGNGDGVVDSADYLLWRKSVNAGSGSSLASVPEPSAMSLALVGMMFCAAKRRSALKSRSDPHLY